MSSSNNDTQKGCRFLAEHDPQGNNHNRDCCAETRTQAHHHKAELLNAWLDHTNSHDDFQDRLTLASPESWG